MPAATAASGITLEGFPLSLSLSLSQNRFPGFLLLQPPALVTDAGPDRTFATQPTAAASAVDDGQIP
jgi:hypothetical protein